MPRNIFLSLGSNLGDREENLRTALGKLEQAGINVVKRSSLYETEPVEVADQPDFLNLVLEVETDLEPGALLTACLRVEKELGRIRERAKGPRKVDIDILFYDQHVINHPDLKIPHPALYRRNFVLTPLEEIAPHFHDPATGKTVAQLRRESPDRSRVERVL